MNHEFRLILKQNNLMIIIILCLTTNHNTSTYCFLMGPISQLQVRYLNVRTSYLSSFALAQLAQSQGLAWILLREIDQ